jgi:hypothetical protein
LLCALDGRGWQEKYATRAAAGGVEKEQTACFVAVCCREWILHGRQPPQLAQVQQQLTIKSEPHSGSGAAAAAAAGAGGADSGAAGQQQQQQQQEQQPRRAAAAAGMDVSQAADPMET